MRWERAFREKAWKEAGAGAFCGAAWDDSEVQRIDGAGFWQEHNPAKTEVMPESSQVKRGESEPRCCASRSWGFSNAELRLADGQVVKAGVM